MGHLVETIRFEFTDAQRRLEGSTDGDTRAGEIAALSEAVQGSLMELAAEIEKISAALNVRPSL